MQLFDLRSARNLMYTDMNINENTTAEAEWFAIRVGDEGKAEAALSKHCEEVFLPTETIKMPDRKVKTRPAIPHVMFIRTTPEKALELEKRGQELYRLPVSFWIYRNPDEEIIRPISQKSIDLLRLLTVDNETKCQVFSKTDFKRDDHVEVTGGIFKGYKGYVQRVKKNLHVVVEIEGLSLILLPFIHPALLKKLPQ